GSRGGRGGGMLAPAWRIVPAVTPFGPHPCVRASSLVSQSVSEPEVETPIFLPLSSASERIGESSGKPTPRKGAGPAVSQTASIGAPLATKAISEPGPSPWSIEPDDDARVV